MSIHNSLHLIQQWFRKDIDMDIHSINLRISELCAQRKWSYYRLAKETGFQQSTLKSIVKEKNMPSLYTLDKICTAFNISLACFFDSPFFDIPTQSNNTFLSLWNNLSSDDKEKVLIYMYGLLHKEISKEDFVNDI